MGPKKKTKVVTKGKLTYGDNRLERSQLEEFEDYSHVDITKNQISDISSLGRALLKHEENDFESKILHIVNESGKRLSYSIISKEPLKIY